MSAVPSRRSAGILLHPTSLPGPYAIGDLGPEAFTRVDQLARARNSLRDLPEFLASLQ